MTALSNALGAIALLSALGAAYIAPLPAGPHAAAVVLIAVAYGIWKAVTR
jgi:hypothetical protein